MSKRVIVHGADLSHHNPDPALKLAKDSGLKFLYHKATEGDSFTDPKYGQRRAQAKTAKVPFGAYHFARAEVGDAKAEARHFIKVADPKPGDLVPALDLETTEKLTLGQLKGWARNFADEVQRLVGVRPVLYSPWDLGLGLIRWVPRYNDSNIPPRIPWDIWQFSNGDLGVPDTFPGLGRVDLNHMHDDFKLERLVIQARPTPEPKVEPVILKFGHASMQFSDTSPQKAHDAIKIFSRGYDCMTGTETGPGSGDLLNILRAEAKERGYRFFKPGRPTDCWIAVAEDLIDGGWATGYEPIIPGSRELYEPQGLDGRLLPRWGPKGLVHVEFDNDTLGHISIGAAHYLTGARSPHTKPVRGVNHWEWNKKLGLAIGEWARRKGNGPGIVFYGGDQNMSDARNNEPQGDTFFGEPLTSLWDELERWENTGHGNIDVIASYDKDGRVRGRKIRALDDKEIFLHTDHFLVEGEFEVKPAKKKKTA